MGKQRVARTRAGNTWTEARYWSFIRGLLRNGFSRYPPKHQAKSSKGRRKKGERRFEYQCVGCRKWFPNSAIQVDHIEPAGSLRCAEDLPGFVTRLFCEADGLQLLCKSCHQTKTNKESEERRKVNAKAKRNVEEQAPTSI